MFNAEYKAILDAAEKVRRSIIDKNIDYISFGGTMPKEDVEEIKAVVNIEKSVFDFLVTRGLKFTKIPDRAGLLETTFEGTRYICKENYTPAMDFESAFSSASDKPETPKEPEAIEEPIEEEKPKEEPEVFTIAYDGTLLEGEVLEDEHVIITASKHKNAREIETLSYRLDSDDNTIFPGENKLTLYNAGDIVAEFTFIAEKKPEPEKTNKAIYIGGEEVNYADSFDTVPPEEERTPITDLVYEKVKISLMHPGFNTEKSEYTVFIAPLKLYRKAASTVPIIATVWKTPYQLKTTASSYDTKESGRNLLTLDIDDYNILIRGTFDESGKFRAVITTTNNSANQGDILEVLDERFFGDNSTHRSVNGHPVQPYDSEEGNAFVFVFPLGEVGDDIFLVASKTDEFCEYALSSSDNFGAHSAMFYSLNGQIIVIPHWDGDEYLEVEVFEE